MAARTWKWMTSTTSLGGFLSHRGNPKSSILWKDFPWNKPASLGYLHDLGNPIYGPANLWFQDHTNHPSNLKRWARQYIPNLTCLALNLNTVHGPLFSNIKQGRLVGVRQTFTTKKKVEKTDVPVRRGLWMVLMRNCRITAGSPDAFGVKLRSGFIIHTSLVLPLTGHWLVQAFCRR